jgi:DNA-binding CsgD family transcriptional regulator
MTRVDCACPRARHQHGHWHAYANDKCRCQPCRDAWAIYHRRTRKTREHYNNGKPFRANITGTARRLQALAVVGWSNHELARRLDSTPFVVWKWQHGGHEWIKPESANRVAALYDDIWDTEPDGRYGRKIRNIAARHGWHPPMAWDDDDIDNPDALPFMLEDSDDLDDIAIDEAMRGRPVRLTKAEKAEAVRRMTARGDSAEQIAQRLHVSGRTVQRKRAA